MGITFKALIGALILISTLLLGCNRAEKANSSSEASTPEETLATSDSEPASSSLATEFSGPMVVDFFATWCGPCRSMEPVWQQMEQKYKGRIAFKKVDVDEQPALAAKYGVQAVPTYLFVGPDGTATVLTGAMPATQFEAQLTTLLAEQ